MTASQKSMNLALQGGGAHGAFASDVLGRLLADGRLNAEGISATSAGAMNAVAFGYGNSVAGREGGREKLHEFWGDLGAGQLYSPVRALPWTRHFMGLGALGA
jgi:NTE family protein